MASDIEYFNTILEGLKARAAERRRKYINFTYDESGRVNTLMPSYTREVLHQNQADGWAVYSAMADDIRGLAKLYLGSEPMNWWKGHDNGK